MLLTALITGCESRISLTPPAHTSKIAVNSVGFTGDTVKVQLSRSVPVLDYEQNKNNLEITNASVQLFTDGIFTTQLQYRKDLKAYVSNTIAKEGKEYSIQISAPKFEFVSASCKASSSVKISSLEKTSNVGKGSRGESLDELRLMFTDQKNLGDVYRIRFLKKTTHPRGVNWSVLQSQVLTTSDPDIFGSNPEIINPFEPQQKIFRLDDIFTRDTRFDGDKKVLRLFIPKLDGLPSFLFVKEQEKGSAQQYYIELSKVNEDYLKFIKSVALSQFTEGDMFSEPTSVYTNVLNGLGIFTISSRDLKEIPK